MANKIICFDKIRKRFVYAYHVSEDGAAHNKSNTTCIGCIGVDLLLPNDILKEINYWMSLFEQCNSRFNKLMDKKSTQCTENYWKQRCEWSELCITRLETVLPFNTVYDSLKTYDCYAQWQQLKSKTSPTGDRDCEELKKELGDIKAVYSKLVKTASAENLNKLQSRISELEEENNKLIMLTKQLLNKHPLVKTIRWKQ